MKIRRWLVIGLWCAVCMVMGASVALGRSPGARRTTSNGVGAQELLQQYVDDLLSAGSDDELAKRAIDLVRREHLHPPLPAKVIELEGEARAALLGAKRQADYQDAVNAFSEAAALAPWLPGVYFDLARTEEAAGAYSAAVDDYKLYLYADPRARDRTAVELRIGADTERMNQSHN